MHVIAHQGPGEAGGGRVDQKLAEAVKKVRVIRIIPEEGGPVDPAHDDMVKGTGRVHSGFAGHNLKRPQVSIYVNLSPSYPITVLAPEIHALRLHVLQFLCDPYFYQRLTGDP